MKRRRLFRSALPALFVLGAVHPAWQVPAAVRRPPGNPLLSADPSLVPAGAALDPRPAMPLSTDPGSLLRWLGHSTLVALAVALAAVVLASAGAYVLSRRRPHGRSGGPKGLPVTQTFAALILLLPLCLLLIPLHRINPHVGVVFVHMTTVLPFCLWQMKNVYDAIPVTLEEAARLDGCGPWQTFCRVILPLAAPGVAVTALFAFVAAWNEAMVAALIRPETGSSALPSGSGPAFPANLSAPWLWYAAGVLVVSVPVVGVLLASSRSLPGGLVKE